MPTNYTICFLALLFLVNVYVVSSIVHLRYGESAIEPMGSCSDGIETIDRAKIALLPNDFTTNITVYAVNKECYECSWSSVGQLPTTPSNAECVLMYTPFEWTLYLADSDDNSIVHDETTYTFGVNGHYDISSTTDRKLNIQETQAPDNALTPFAILLGILTGIIILSFAVPALLEWRKEKYLSLKYQTSFSSNDVSYTAVLVTDSSDPEATPSSNKSPLITEPVNISKLQPVSSPSVLQPPKKSKVPRLKSLDTFRGISLTLMIFVNYGGGGYWFFDHAAWNGLTLADCVFPWFMWIMGVSMALSFHNILPPFPSMHDTNANYQESVIAYRKEYYSVWYKATKRAIILFLLGMFLANGYEYTTWRVPGVLQYFAASYFVTAATILCCYEYTQSELRRIVEGEAVHSLLFSDSSEGSSTCFGYSIPAALRSIACYRYEWLLQIATLFLYLVIALAVPAPGCPVGYNGPGGISEDSNYSTCTGGIHRYIDMHAFGYWFIFHRPTCQLLYHCPPYDPEGLLGVLSACNLTYLGLMTGRVTLHFIEHKDRIKAWCTGAVVLLFLAGCLCGFSQNDGVIPVNKNLWSTSFVFVTSGFGLIGLSLCYVAVDWYKVWTGAPFLFMGMNSIMIYCGHGILGEYMPFSYMITHINHAGLLLMNVIGTAAWLVIAYYCYKIKFFIKI